MENKTKYDNDFMRRVINENKEKKISNIPNESLKKGENLLNRLEEVYGDIPVVDIVSDTWKERKKTNLIKWMMIKSNVGIDVIAEYLGCSKQYLNNKFNRDSFSIEDLILASYACNFTITLRENNGKGEYRVIPKDFFDTKSVEWDRISRIRNCDLESKRAEYEQKKAELERMKKEYGFE